MKVLITGGAGFIGSHLADLLVKRGCSVRILDNLEPQVHGSKGPEYINIEAEFIRGDVRDIRIVERCVEGMEAVFHFAAAVGVGQSQYEPVKYVEANVGGTANLIRALIEKKPDLARLVVAGSMSVYGEGDGFCEEHGVVRPAARAELDLRNRRWEPRCPRCGGFVSPVPVKETSCPAPTSIYAVSKLSQEQMALVAGEAHGWPVTVLRFFNVYGPRQSLSNPYTGVAAIFASRLKHDKPPVIFEDGKQSRDFVHVNDVASVCEKVLGEGERANGVFNVGTSGAVTIEEIANFLSAAVKKKVRPEVTNKYRKGDIRHCIADISKLKEHLGLEPGIQIRDGIEELAEWCGGEACDDYFEDAYSRLKSYGLTE